MYQSVVERVKNTIQSFERDTLLSQSITMPNVCDIAQLAHEIGVVSFLDFRIYFMSRAQIHLQTQGVLEVKPELAFKHRHSSPLVGMPSSH